ncbi:hypothetical protein SGQ83_03950 [Flavobacterium sp. Fl-318]|uniref:Lipoprotein n=1 Tax=Flavobacterium cupriresistens TaxID=2893885 RepID=A0ABU4R901_9FLAO|nr:MULTISPECIES: hypothetical protein [unclassified Flavobacterium]MDX6188493.1 hypothetical protein [Flavobacterium sp. Fl-318]UFH44836.1 hypothetical protein LNP23_11700 [Flavobacterium sp. F-323]
MVKFCLILGFFFVSCETIKYKKLDDGISKIPVDKFFFHKNYRNKYEIALLKMIDINSVYIESFYLDPKDKFFNSQKGFNSFINGLKFYGNGCVSNFVINKDSLFNLPKLDPLKRGSRGISFIKQKDTVIEIIVPIDETYNLGKKQYYLKVHADTLFLEDKQTSLRYIYLKHKLHGENTKFKADW